MFYIRRGGNHYWNSWDTQNGIVHMNFGIAFELFVIADVIFGIVGTIFWIEVTPST